MQDALALDEVAERDARAGPAPAGRLLHIVRAGSPRSGYQAIERWSALRSLRKARAAAAICRPLREMRGASPPVAIGPSLGIRPARAAGEIPS